MHAHKETAAAGKSSKQTASQRSHGLTLTASMRSSPTRPTASASTGWRGTGPPARPITGWEAPPPTEREPEPVFSGVLARVEQRLPAQPQARRPSRGIRRPENRAPPRVRPRRSRLRTPRRPDVASRPGLPSDACPAERAGHRPEAGVGANHPRPQAARRDPRSQPHAHGTGAMNIDATRIALQHRTAPAKDARTASGSPRVSAVDGQPTCSSPTARHAPPRAASRTARSGYSGTATASSTQRRPTDASARPAAGSCPDESRRRSRSAPTTRSCARPTPSRTSTRRSSRSS